MDKDKILSYVMKSPANTNPNVLKTLLDGGGGGGDFIAVQVTAINNHASAIMLGIATAPIKDHLLYDGYRIAFMFDSEIGVNPSPPHIDLNSGDTKSFLFYLKTGENFSIGADSHVLGDALTYTANGQAEVSYIEDDDENRIPCVIITGDCTITIS